MGFFHKLSTTFNKSSDLSALPWLELTALVQLEEIKEFSKTKPQLIFKHSTRCGISSMVLRRFEDDYYLHLKGKVDLFYLDLLSYRDISNEISSRFGVYHESPQLLIVKNGKVIKHASHGAINDLDFFKIL